MIHKTWRRHRAYLKYVLRHKYYVFLEGRKLQVPVINLIIHDWDKFLPKMWLTYANAFYNEDGTSRYLKSDAFDVQWNFHQKRNKHHWQHWVLVYDNFEIVTLRIPVKHCREMLADWRGAGRASGKPDTKAWYLERQEKFKQRLDPVNRLWIERQLGIK